MEHYDVIFFDTPFIQIKRFCAPVARELKNLRPDLKTAVVVLLAAPASSPIAIEDCPKELQDSFDKVFLYSEIGDLDKFLIDTQAKVLFFAANRIPDIEIVLHAKRLGIKTITLQHGVFFRGCCINEFTAYNAFASIKIFDKVINYLTILKRMSKYDHSAYLKVLSKVFLKKGDLQALAMNAFSIPLRCDYLLIIGEYWIDYYKEEYGYDPAVMRMVGDHDLDDLADQYELEPAICYIANTLVEEGTIKRKEFQKFIDIMANCIDKKTKLYVKLHPLSDKALYEPLENHNVVFMSEAGELPAVSVYIGHRSTLIGRALFHSDQLILWRFKAEKECFYADFATKVCMSEQELKDAFSIVDLNRQENTKINQIEQIYQRNPRGVFSSCATLVAECFDTGKIEANFEWSNHG